MIVILKSSVLRETLFINYLLICVICVICGQLLFLLPQYTADDLMEK